MSDVKTERKCENCKWYAEFEGVCCNGDSEHRAEFTDKDFCCEEFKKPDVRKISENKNLLPCPFCGGKAVIITIKHKEGKREYAGKYIQCEDCGVRTEEQTGDRMWCYVISTEEVEEMLIKQWNSRDCSCKNKGDE